MSFYTVTGSPGTRSFGSSAAIRAEFQAIATAFGVFPALAGNSGKVMVVNPGETGFEFQTAVTYLTQTAADSRYLAQSGGIFTGPLVGLMDSVGLRTRPSTAAANPGFAVDDVNAVRKLEMLYLGASSAGLYGAVAGSSVINATGALTVSINDTPRLAFDTSGHASLYGQLLAIGGETMTGNYGLRLLNSTLTGGGEVTALAGTGAGLKIGADAGPLAVWTGGAQRLWLDASGKLGIGGSPAYALDLQGNGSTLARVFNVSGTVQAFLNAAASTGVVGTLSGHDFLFGTNSIERGRVTAAGLWSFGGTDQSAAGAMLNVGGPVFSSLSTNTVSGFISANGISDFFTVDTDKRIANYGLQWKLFSDTLAGPSAALSGFGGIRMYVGAAEKSRFDPTGMILGAAARTGIGAGTDTLAVAGNVGFTSQLNGNAAAFVDIINRGAGGFRFYTAAGAQLALTVNNTGLLTDANGDELGYKVIPIQTYGDGATITTAARGRCVVGNYSSLTVPSATFARGDSFMTYQDGAGAMTLVQGSGLTMRLAGTTTTGSRTVAARGQATVWFNAAGECIVSGAGVS